MMKRFFIIAAFVAFAGLTASAQSTGILRGRVLDSNEAVVPGATLTLGSPALQEPKTATSDEDGNYVFLGLPPGIYQLQATSGNFAPFTQEELSVRAGGTLTFDVKLGVAGVDQKVNVHAGGENTPIVDTSNPEQNINVSGDFINKLPLGSRQNWDSVWFLVPGAVTIGRTGPDENIDPQIHGASERSNSYQLNGFDISNSFTNQGWTTQFSTNIIQDVQIKTSGVDASTPLGTGGHINVVTKSGGNQFHGSAEFFYQPRKFNWTNIPGGTPLDQKLIQPDFSLGGPIFKNKTWFFASYRRALIDQGVPRTAAVLQTFRDNGFEVPDYDKLERNNRFFGKLTHQLNGSNTVSFNYLNDKGTTFNSDSRDLGTQEATIDIINGGPTYIFSWTSNITSKLLLTTTYGYRKNNSIVELNGGDNPSVNRFATTRITGGNRAGQTLILQYGNRASVAQGSEGVRDQHELTSDLTYVRDGWFGQHTFQTGFQWKPKTRSSGFTVYPKSGLVIVDEVRRTVDGNVVYTPFRRQFRSPAGLGSVQIMKVLGFYVQDKWVPHPRLTLSFGLRADRQKNVDTLDAERLNTLSFGPRFGLAYSLTKSGKDVVRVSWGRVHDVIYNQVAPPVSGFRSPEIRNEWDNNFDGVFETVRVTPSIGINGPPGVNFSPVDPNLHAPFINDFHIGYTRQLPYRLVFDFSYVNRKFMHEIVGLDTNIIYENGLFAGYRDPDLEGFTETTNLKSSYQRYQALEFSLIRNVGGRFQSFISYTYQKMVEKGDFRYDDPQGYLNPREWFENDKLARPHLFRFNASYYLPYRFTIAAIFSVQAGDYSGELVKDLAANDPEVAAHGPQIVTINGRTYFNPLFTTTRLVGLRSEGQLQTGSLPRLNLRFGKEFRFKDGNQSLEFNVDFFNITNNATPMFFRAGANNTSSTTFGQFSSTVQSPRGAQLSVRYRF